MVNVTLVCETSLSTGRMDDTRNGCSGLEYYYMTDLAEKDTSRRSPSKRPCSDQGYQSAAHVNAALLHCRSNSSNTAMSKREVRGCVIKLADTDEQSHHPGRGSSGFISLVLHSSITWLIRPWRFYTRQCQSGQRHGETHTGVDM